jgi:hypothetical protein
MLGELLALRADRIAELMEELERLELAVMDTFVERPCGSAGLGTRRVPAWRAIRRQALVERATIMVKAEDEEAMEYCIEPTLEQPSTVFGPSYLSSGICNNRVQEGSGVSQILQ